MGLWHGAQMPKNICRAAVVAAAECDAGGGTRSQLCPLADALPLVAASPRALLFPPAALYLVPTSWE